MYSATSACWLFYLILCRLLNRGKRENHENNFWWGRRFFSCLLHFRDYSRVAAFLNRQIVTERSLWKFLVVTGKREHFFGWGRRTTVCSTFNIVNREDVVVAARKQRSDCAHSVHRGEQLIENAVKALKRDGIARVCCYSFGGDPPNGKSLGWKTWRAEHFLFILGLAQLKFKSIAMILVDVLMNNFGRNTNSVYFQEIVLFLLK